MISETKPDYENTPISRQRPLLPHVPEDSSDVPFLSIVTPFFNAGGTFVETMQSVQCQTFQQWEWIIVDDASTSQDGTHILESLRSRDSRVKVVTHPRNLGPSAARNTGYREAQSDFIFQLDSDDLLEPTTIEKLVWFLISHPEWSFGGTYQVGFQENRYLNSNGFHVRDKFLSQNFINPTALVRKGVHAAVGGYSEEMREGLEDWDFWLKCAEHGYWGGTVPEFLVWYRWRDNPLSRWRTWGDPLRHQAFRETMRGKYPKIFSGAFPMPTIEFRGNRVATGEVPGLRNFLKKEKKQIVLIGNGDEEGLPHVVDHLVETGAEVSFLAMNTLGHEVLHTLSQFSPDIFSLPHFLRREEVLRFFTYFIRSRGAELIVFGNTPLNYRLLPAVTLALPGARRLDTSTVGGLTPEGIRRVGL